MKQPRRDPATLIWEYLDGGISPTRAEHLSALLAERQGLRDQFVESAVLHGMLHEHFRNAGESEATPNAASDRDAAAVARRRQRRRSSAA